MPFEKGREKTGGKVKGTPNKVPAALKDMVLQALSDVGGVEYLKEQAVKEPKAFMALIGRTLPFQLTGANGGTLEIILAERIKEARERLT